MAALHPRRTVVSGRFGLRLTLIRQEIKGVLDGTVSNLILGEANLEERD
jgi:hypothetical protein